MPSPTSHLVLGLGNELMGDDGFGPASPVVFMIDTGSTTVSVSSEIASQAGIEKCSPQIVSTANGKVNACKATVSEVTFGMFQLTNVEVIVIPNMPGDALLGMNVLRNFHIEQIDNVMRISSR